MIEREMKSDGKRKGNKQIYIVYVHAPSKKRKEEVEAIVGRSFVREH